jgi:hypothetical protein
MTRIFYDELLEYTQMTEGNEEDNHNIAKWNNLIQLSLGKDVSESEIIQAFFKAFSEYPSHRLKFLFLIQSIVTLSREKRQYTYPEFFWIIASSGVLDEIKNYANRIRLFVDICGTDVGNYPEGS